MKKVLFLSPLPPPNYGSATSSKMCLDILKSSKEFKVKNIKLNTAKDFSSIGKLNFSKISSFFKTSSQIKKELKESPEIVYFVPATYGLGLIRDCLYVRKIKKHYPGKILFHIRSRITEEHWKNPLNRFCYKKMFSHQKAIVLDDSLKSDLHNLIPPRDIAILPNAIPNQLIDKDVEKIIENRKSSRKLNLLFISNMERTKGWQILLNACKILSQKKQNFKCVFAGAWPSDNEKNSFEKFVEKNKLEKFVKYVGPAYGKQKDNLLRNADILIYPTKLDTFGKVIIEAMQYGLPVIANGIGAIPTTVQHSKTGFVMNKNSPEEIYDYIQRLKDFPTRKKLGTLGRKRFLQFYEEKNYAKSFTRTINFL